MFVSTSKLVKFAKEAYKTGGIRFGNLDDGLVIIGSSWGLWIDENYIPNKVKAIVMELAGTLPEKNTVFTVNKDDPRPQYELVLNDHLYINRVQQSSKNSVISTGTFLNLKFSEYELLQIACSKKIVMVNRKLMELIDFNEIDHDIENEPAGPCTDYGGSFFWRNATCTLMLLGFKVPEDNPVINALERIDFEEEAKK